ncbi:endonuclease/exonuclease/phosphatase family protein [Streptomyces sp. CO7]
MAQAKTADPTDPAAVGAGQDGVGGGGDGAGGDDAGPGAARGPRATLRRTVRAASRPRTWRRGPVLTALALLLGLVLLLHPWITDAGGLGSLVETFLPWFGLLVPVLLLLALRRRSPAAVLVLLLPVTAWLGQFGGLLADKSQAGGDLTVVQHNVGEANPDPAGTARELAGSGADVLALVELAAKARGTYEKELAEAYPYHSVQGTVGLWSRLPLSETRAVDIAMDAGPLGDRKPAAEKLTYNRALRTTVATDRGPLTVYVAHLGSVRLMPRGGFWTDSRDRNAQALAEALAAERSERLVLLGDLNGTVDDRALEGVTSGLTSAQEEAGDGFGFTWPAAFPVARIDQVLAKGVRPVGSWVLPATGSDHLPVAARLAW